jgi:hypothetical protein
MLDWRVSRDIVQKRFNVDYTELLAGGALLLVGGIILGVGLASFANPAGAFAVSMAGGVMIFAGIVLGTRSFVATVRALEGIAKAEYGKEIQEKTRAFHQTRFTYSNLQGQVARVQKDLKQVVATIRSRGLRF